MIVDTNALSAWRDSDEGLLQAISGAALLVLPVVAIGEFRYGISRSRQRSEAGEWLDRVIRTIRVVGITIDTAETYASIRSMLHQKGRPIPTNDAWIAALALQHRLPVLSKDAHFDAVDGLTRVGW